MDKSEKQFLLLLRSFLWTAFARQTETKPEKIKPVTDNLVSSTSFHQRAQFRGKGPQISQGSGGVECGNKTIRGVRGGRDVVYGPAGQRPINPRLSSVCVKPPTQ